MLSTLQQAARPPASPTRAADTDDAEVAPRRRLRCRACGRPLADPDDRIELLGGHMHVFVNPHGLDFRVRLFAAAAGAVPVGALSQFYSWFPGYPWRILVCGGCGVHIGWTWGAPPAFVGLVADRLVEETGE